MKEQFLSFIPSEIYLGFKVDTAAAALGMVAGREETLLLINVPLNAVIRRLII